MRPFGTWADGVAGASGESCNWGDGGGGSGASTGESGSNARKLIADELAGWIGRQEQVVRELKQQQEQATEQIRQMLDCSLARHERTLERLFAWYLQPQKDAPPTQKVFSAAAPVYGAVASTLTGDAECASSTLVEDISGPQASVDKFIHTRSDKSNSWVAEVTDLDAFSPESAQRPAPTSPSNTSNRGSIGSTCSSSSRASTSKKRKKTSLLSADADLDFFEGIEHVKKASLKELTDQAVAGLETVRKEAKQQLPPSAVKKIEPVFPGAGPKGPAAPPAPVQPPHPNAPPSGAPANLRHSMLQPNSPPSAGEGKLRTSVLQANAQRASLMIPEQAADQPVRKSRTSISPVVAVIPQFAPQPEKRSSKKKRSSSESKKSRKSMDDENGTLHEGDEKESGDSDDDSDVSLDEEGRQRSRRLSKFSAWEAEVRGRAKSIHEERFDTTLTRQVAEEKKSKKWLARIVRSVYFDWASAILLASNAILIGFQVENRLSSLSDETPATYEILNTIYGLLFLAELIARICADGYKKYFTGYSWCWNWFDFIVVSLQVIEIIAAMAVLEEGGAVPKYLILGRLVRVARIIRVVRVIRVMRFFRAFRILLTMIFGTMKNGAWATLLLVLIMYIFAIVFTQSLSDHLIDLGGQSLREKEEYSDLMFYYGSMPRAILTLFKSIIGGVDWEVVLLPLSKVGWVLGLLFLGYISFVQLAVMNVVTGLFLQSAIEQAQSDQEHVIQLRLAEKQNFVDRLHYLFHELDSSNDGCISLSEFESHLKNEHMQAMLQTFEIDNADAWTLFKLLDTDGGGSVDIDEFVDGCIRLKGGAKSIQMAQIMYHHKWIMDKLTDLSNTIQKQLKPMSANQGVLATYIANLSTELHRAVTVGDSESEEEMVEEHEDK